MPQKHHMKIKYYTNDTLVTRVVPGTTRLGDIVYDLPSNSDCFQAEGAPDQVLSLVLATRQGSWEASYQLHPKGYGWGCSGRPETQQATGAASYGVRPFSIGPRRAWLPHAQPTAYCTSGAGKGKKDIDSPTSSVGSVVPHAPHRPGSVARSGVAQTVSTILRRLARECLDHAAPRTLGQRRAQSGV